MIVDKMKKREPTAKKIKNKVDIPVGKWIKCDKSSRNKKCCRCLLCYYYS